MAENLLNINTYISKINEQTSTPKKTYMDSSSSFDNVFNSVTKSYDAEKKLSDASTVEKFVDKENFNKVEDKKSYDDSSKIKEKDESTSSNDKVSRKSEDDSDKPKEKDNSEKSEDTNSKAGSENNAKKAVDAVLLQEKATSTVTVVEALVSQAVSLLAKISNTPGQPTGEAASVGVAKTGKDAKQDAELNKLAASVDPKNLKAKVQTEVQQVLSNLKVEPEAKAVAADTSALKGATDAKAQSPLIQASAEVAAKVDGTSNKKITKEILEKAALTQDMLDKTSATVVSVQTSASSGNLLNQQNAKEQGVKLSLETSGTSNNPNSASITNLNAQVNFDKKLESAQAPKEINKTEVLSQVNAKWEQLKDTGTTKVTIVLKPENLGKINLELINSKDGFTARLTADNAQVKELLDKNLDSLKSSLASQGVNVGSVTVKVAETEKQSNEMFSFEQRQSETADHQASSHSGNSGNSNNTNNSGNSYGSRNAQGDFEEDIINTAQSGSSDDSGSKISHNGQVDYKI